nr:RNA exonuclease 1 homolog isoform X2 [Microcebus murinus]
MNALGTSMEELERINRKIELVRTEVEEEQKRLATFTSVLGELTQGRMAASVDTNVRRDFPENSLLPKEKQNESSKNKDSEPRKYVIDHRCPATDLEYDPLLNYTAELLGASKAKLNDTDRQQFCHLKKSVGEDCGTALESQRHYASPIKIKINLQESDEDDLVIDVPPVMSTSKKSRLFRGFQQRHEDKRIHTMLLEKSNLQISGTEEEKIGKTQITTQIDDDNNRLEPPTLLMNTSRDIKSNVNLYCVKTHISKMGSFGDEKKHDSISEEGVCYVPLSDKEILKESDNESYSKSKKYVKTIYNTKKKEIESWHSPSQPPIFYSEELVKDNVLRMQGNSKEFTTFEDSKLADFDADKGPTGDDTPSDSDAIMQECLHIFNEFTQSEAHKKEIAKQASGKQDMLHYKNTSGPKKRIAHTAKFDVPISKEIISPWKGPVSSLISHSRIIRAQQQAAHIKAAVKSGRAFIAATSEQKKNESICPASQTQRKENSLTSNSLHLDVALSSENPTAKPRRSHIPVKSIASLSVKTPKYKVAHRRRASVTSESSPKVPNEVRERYLDLFIEKYLKVCKTEEEALNKAKTEEKAIYERCGSRNMYMNIAVNSLKKIKDQVVSGSSNDKTAGFKNYEKKTVLTETILYRHLKGYYLLIEEQLHEHNYPQSHPEKPGSILLNPGMTKPLLNDASKKICCRCGKIYGVTSSGKHSRVEECNYHFGQVLSHKVLGGLESRYSCCGGVLGSPGCQVAKLHVHNQKENLEGFVKTFVKVAPPDGSHGVFAVNCEMCYTAKGLELTRVTVVDSSLQVVYDTFVKPDEEVIDYNTRFSGVVEDDLKNTTTSIRDVQAVLLNLFSADTIIIGHSFASSLYALKLIHSSLVDTSVMFPHRLGLPHKRSLRNLVAEYLQRIIQDDGHDSSENAKACMELVLWKVKEDLKGKK